MEPSKPEKGFALIIILILVIIFGIGAYVVSQKSSLIRYLVPSRQSSSNAKSLFGIMTAFPVEMNTGGNQKSWTEFRKDNSAYQSFLSNFKKTIQDRTKLVKETGFSLDRMISPYFTWNVIEPQKGQFDWELTDIYVKGATDAGIKISAVIMPFAGWDQKNVSTIPGCSFADSAFYDYKTGPPNDIAEYENFLTKTVERYKDNIAVWEIENEPDGPCGGYMDNPQGYLDLFKITSETIKKADPNAKVTNGGTSDVSYHDVKSFWQQFFALGGGQYIDYLNTHYDVDRSSNATLSPAAFEEGLAFFNDLMDKNGGRKPLYITEFGVYSGSPSSEPVSQSTQGTGQAQTNSPTQPTSSGQSLSQSTLNGKCGDGICDNFEKQDPSKCPQDCSGNASTGNSGQSTQRQTTGQTLSNLSPNDQAVLYFKYSVIAFASGVKKVFIDLVGLPDDNIIGSSMAFDASGQPRLFLTTLKMIDSKIDGFSKGEKIADGQYKFTVGGKTTYALWSGTLPNEISGKVKVTDIKGQEQTMDATSVKLNADQPIFLEAQ